MAVDSTSLYNPYAMMYGMNAQNGLSDDFMWNAYMANSQKTAQGGQQQTFTGNNLSGQPSTDCYQNSGSSALTDGLKLGLAGGAGIGLGMYYLGGDKVSPLVNGKFDDQFLKTFEGDHVAKIGEEYKVLEQSKLNDILRSNGITSEAEYQALKNVAQTGEPGSGYLRPLGASTKEAAQAKLDKINQEFAQVFDKEKELAKVTKEYMRTNSLSGSTEYLKQLRAQETLIRGMKDTDSLEKLIRDNAKAFGIEATEETKITEEARNIASTYRNNKAGALKYLEETAIKNQNDIVEGLRTNLTTEAKKYWDEAGKCIREGAPETAQKAFKNFKFTKAGKAGLIAAGVGLVLGWMFGGKS